MKKMIFWLCALMLVPALAIADGDGVSISELKAQTPNYLEGSYEAHGRHMRPSTHRMSKFFPFCK